MPERTTLQRPEITREQGPTTRPATRPQVGAGTTRPSPTRQEGGPGSITTRPRPGTTSRPAATETRIGGATTSDRSQADQLRRQLEGMNLGPASGRGPGSGRGPEVERGPGPGRGPDVASGRGPGSGRGPEVERGPGPGRGPDVASGRGPGPGRGPDRSGYDWDRWRPPQYTPPVRPNVVVNIQANFGGYRTFWTNDWYRRYNYGWRPSIYIDPYHWWVAPRWGTTWEWFYGYRPYYYDNYYSSYYTPYAVTSIPTPAYYNYGDNIVYQGDMVYINGVPFVSADKYYEQSMELARRGEKTTVVQVINSVPGAQTLVDGQPQQMIASGSATQPVAQPVATPEGYVQTVAKPESISTEPAETTPATADADADPSEQWMPLGTFAILPDDDSESSDQIMQLAMNRGGIIRGNFYDQKTDNMVKIEGAVDQESQRVAFKIPGEDDQVYECGLWNLTQESLSMLVHEGKNKTETKKLVRLEDPDSKEKNSTSDDTSDGGTTSTFDIPTPGTAPNLDL